MQQLRNRWRLILTAVLAIGVPVAWYKWPSTASAAAPLPPAAALQPASSAAAAVIPA